MTEPKQVVVVEYYDHCYAETEDGADPSICRDIGYFVKENRTDKGVGYIIISTGIDENDDFVRPFSVILKNDIIKITEVKLNDKLETVGHKI